MLNRSASRVLLLVLGLGAAIGAGFFAGHELSRSDDDRSVDPTPPITAMSRSGTLSEQFPLPMNVEWSEDLSLAYLGPGGVVTSLDINPGDFHTIASGSAIGAVDGQPIVIVEGDHPAYRAMDIGVSGPDVAQLQQFLVSLGLLDAIYADADFGVATATALEQWWSTVGVDDLNTVPRGSVVFVADLPRLITVDPSMEVGDLIVSGAPLLAGLSPTPVVTAILSQLQEQRFLAEGAEFSIVRNDGTEIGLTVTGTQAQEQATALSLEVVAAQLDQLASTLAAPGSDIRLSGRMTITAPTEGTIVPIAALNDLVAPETTIRLANGDAVAVTVVAVVGGEAIVEPLEPGVSVVVGR